MLKNYLLTTFRNLRRQKGYAFINVLGLAVGLACSFFILHWVMNELSYDRFHEDGERLFRVMRHGYLEENTYTWGSVPKPLADVLAADYPEVENAMLIDGSSQSLIAHAGEVFKREGKYVDAAFFEAFTFPLIRGEASTVLEDPHSIVVSEDLASSLFGADWQTDASVVGEVLHVDNRADFRVTGVFENVPENSSLQFDFVLPMSEYLPRNEWVEDWGNAGLQLYVRLKPGADYQVLNEKIKDVIRENEGFADATPFLHPFTDMRLHSDFRGGELVGGRITYVRVFSAMAVFLLLIACINFMNLATARSAKRAKEVGVRKTIGATQALLIRQFMVESLVTASAAFVLALGLVLALLPAYNSLSDGAMRLGDLDLSFVGMMLGISLLTGLVAGSYPALYLSSFRPIQVLRGSIRQGRSTGSLRKGLVVFQFGLSTLLIVGTFAIHSQVDYIRTVHLGLDRSNLVITRVEGGVAEQYESFRQRLMAMPGIENATTSSQNPLHVGNNTTAPTWEGKSEDNATLFYIINANYDFVETMKMDLAEGRTFSRSFGSDTANVVINESAARAMGMDEPVGQSFSMWGREGQIIGVVKDFSMNSLYEAIEPTIIRLDPPQTHMLFVRSEPGKTTEALASLEAVQDQVNPGYPFEYEFLDDAYEETYRSEMVMGRLANAFAIVAIFVSCLGLFGLSSFAAEQRRKEIGVRKVLGSSVSGLVVLLSKDFTRLVMVAFVLAAPLAYFAVDRWLAKFEQHAEIGPMIFVVAGVATLVLALLSVSYQAIRAAVADPVKSLRYE